LVYLWTLVFGGVVASIYVPEMFLWSMGLTILLVSLCVLEALSLLAMKNIEVIRSCPDQVEAGATFTLRYRLLSPSAASLRLVDELPEHLDESKTELGPVLILKAGQILIHAVDVKTLRRGGAVWGQLNLLVDGPIGLFTRRQRFSPEGASSIRIYPRLHGLDAAFLDPRLMLADLGIKPKMKQGDGSEFHRIRLAQKGDSRRRIDWRATARRAKPMVRDYRPEQCDDIFLCLDHGRLMGAPLEDSKTKLDHAIEAVLRFAFLALNTGDRVGFVNFAEQSGTWIKPSAGRTHLSALMLACFDLKASTADANHAEVMMQLARRQSKRALIVFFTDFVDPEAAEDMVQALAILKRRHRVLFVGINDPVTASILNKPVLDSTDSYRGLAALQQELTRSEVINRVSALGIDALDLSPFEISAASINAYLRIRARGIS